MSRDGINGRGHHHGNNCDLIACRRQLMAAKETIREAEEILEGKYCGDGNEGHKGGHGPGPDCGDNDLRECEFKLRILNRRIVKSADVLNEYIDEYINDDCECECCCCCCCSCESGCSNFYDNPFRYNRETCSRDRNNCGCESCCCWGR